MQLASIDCVAVFCQILAHIAQDPVLGILPRSPGWKTQFLAKELQTQDWTEEPRHQCAIRVMEVVTNALEKASQSQFSCAGNLEMLAAVNVSSLSLRQQWYSTLHLDNPTVDCAAANNVLQHVIDLAIPAIGHQINECTGSKKVETVQASDLTETEKEVLHYCLGYIIRKLQRRFEKNKTNKACMLYLDVIATWATPSDRVLCDDIQQWTKCQDRGGLTYCTAEYYQFMKTVECHLKSLLNKENISQYSGEKVVPVMVHRLKSFSSVRSAFQKLIGYTLTSEELCHGLLEEVLVCWVHTKC